MRFDPVTIISAGDMSTSAVNSSAPDLNQMFAFSIQAVYTGSPVGTLKLQASCDNVAPGGSVTNWTDITGSSVAVSAAGDTIWSVANFGYRFIRLVYTKTSGTGTLNAVFNGRGQ